MKQNNEAIGAISLLLTIVGIIGFGGLYTLGFYIVLPHLYVLIPNSIFKSFIIYGVVWYAPFVVVIVGILALIQSGLKHEWRETIE